MTRKQPVQIRVKLLDPYKGKLHAMAVSLPNRPTVTVRFAVADGMWAARCVKRR